MSTGEIIGAVASAALLGLVIGGWVVLAQTPRRLQREQRRRVRLDAYARWLAARRSVTRASISLVAAFRSLAAEKADSRLFALRSLEAQRARSDWCEQVRELDAAESVLLVHGTAATNPPPWRCIRRVDAEGLQKAIDETDDTVRSLVLSLHQTDREAEKIVQAVVEHEGAFSVDPAAARLIGRLARWIQDITNGWQHR
jgi:hypothetical protein